MTGERDLRESPLFLTKKVSRRKFIAGSTGVIFATALNACGGGSGDKETPLVTSTGTPRSGQGVETTPTVAPASPEVTVSPSATAEEGATSPEGNVEKPYIDLLEGKAFVEDDRLLVEFKLAGLPEESSQDMEELIYFLWNVRVWPDGVVEKAPLFMNSTPILPLEGEQQLGYRVSSFQANTDGSSPSVFWPGGIEIERETRTVKVWNRIPNLSDKAQVQIDTFLIRGEPGDPVTPRQHDILGPFAANKDSFDEGRDFPSVPTQIEGERQADGTTIYNLEKINMPLTVPVPSDWAAYTTSESVVFVAPETVPGQLSMSFVHVRAGTLGAEELLARIVDESAGAYRVLPEEGGFDLPEGFGATALLKTERRYEVGYDPQKVLQNWFSLEGVTGRYMIAALGDNRAIIAVLESADREIGRQFEKYLSQVQLDASLK